MAPTILLTRAEDAAAEFAGRLRAEFSCGVNIVLSPLMRIEHISDQPADHNGFASVIFTSRNAVRAFAARTTRRDWPCYCAGDATATAAMQAGFRAISANGTARDLATLLMRDKPGTPCLYARGDHVASDLAETLNSAGIETIESVLYRQKSQDLNDKARALLNRENPVILPLFSPRSTRIFFDQDTGSAPILVAAISDNAAQCVPADRVVDLRVSSAPTTPAMLDTLKALFDAANRLEGGRTAQ